MLRPGFRAKILVLLGIPLIVQVFCSIELPKLINSETRRYEQLLRSERIKSADLMVDTAFSTSIWFGAIKSLGQVQGMADVAKQQRARLTRAFDEARVLAYGKHARQFAKVERNLLSGFDVLVNVEPDADETAENKARTEAATFEAWCQVSETTGKKEFILFKIIENSTRMNQISGLLNAREPEKLERKNLNHLLLLLFVNSLVPLILMLVMTTQLSSRLKKIREDTLCFAVNRELSDPLKGTDEFAIFDQTLHRVGHEMRAVQEFRKQLVAVVGHDLKSPLTSIQGTLTMMIEGVYGKLEDRALSKVVDAMKQTQRLKVVIGNLLELERIEGASDRLEMEPFDVTEMMDDTIGGVDEMAAEKAVRIVVDAEEITHTSERDLVMQALTQLVLNALRAAKADSEIVVSARKSGSVLELAVVDDGSGIDAELDNEPFQPFIAAVCPGQRSEDWGAGLGLAVAVAAVEKLGGKIGYQNQSAGGVRFWIRIPSGTQNRGEANDS